MPSTYERTCENCGALFATHHKVQRACSVPCRAALQRGRAGRDAVRDRLAQQLVREWSPAKRARIRHDTILLACWLYGPDEYRHSPEVQLAALIDRINEEEKVA